MMVVVVCDEMNRAAMDGLGRLLLVMAMMVFEFELP